MASKNSFKLLEEEHPHTPPDIEQNVVGSMRVVKMAGNVVELYLSKIFSIFVSLLGGRSEQADDHSFKDTDDSPKGGSLK